MSAMPSPQEIAWRKQEDAAKAAYAKKWERSVSGLTGRPQKMPDSEWARVRSHQGGAPMPQRPSPGPVPAAPTNTLMGKNTTQMNPAQLSQLNQQFRQAQPVARPGYFGGGTSSMQMNRAGARGGVPPQFQQLLTMLSGRLGQYGAGVQQKPAAAPSHPMAPRGRPSPTPPGQQRPWMERVWEDPRMITGGPRAITGGPLVDPRMSINPRNPQVASTFAP